MDCGKHYVMKLHECNFYKCMSHFCVFLFFQVSGLVEHISMWDLNNRSVIVLCNLKPAKMRGIVSEGMVMCASSHSTVELLVPPEGSVAGDLVEVDGYPRDPDTVIDARKSAYETIAEDLKTNSEGVATYKGAPWRVPGKGLITVSTLTDSSIR